MLMSILVRIAQLMVELKGRNERRKGNQADRERCNEKQERSPKFHHRHLSKWV